MSPHKRMLLRNCFVALVFILLLGCEKEDLSTSSPKIVEYDLKSMLYPSAVMATSEKVRLIYNRKNKITERVGNLIPTALMYYKFYEYVGDTVVYYPDSIIISKNLLSTKDYTSMEPCKRKLFLENGLIVKEIHTMEYYGFKYDPDTLLYHYNERNQIDQITSLKSERREYSKLKYDDNGNLQIVASKIDMFDFRGNSSGTLLDSIWFQDYDDAPNLTKDLIIFPECFYRALSTNNFMTYIHKQYRGEDSLVIRSEERHWDLQYDEKNNPIY